MTLPQLLVLTLTVQQRRPVVRLYAMLCPIAYILLVMVNMLRYIAQIQYKVG